MNHDKKNTNLDSILNTDAFDKRRFKEILQMSPSLKKLKKEKNIPLVELFLSDLWASFYKMKPEFTTVAIEGQLVVNKTLMQRIMKDESYRTYRSITRLDDLASAIATIRVGGLMNHWLADQLAEDEMFKNQLESIQAFPLIGLEIAGEDASETKESQSSENGVEVIAEFDQNLQRKLLESKEELTEALMKAMQEMKQVKENLRSLLGGYTAGNAEAELKKVPLRDKLELAERLSSDKKVKEIAEWAGRFKQIARKKQKVKHSESVERKGVTLGNEIEKILPVEFALYMHPHTRTDFLRRFVEGQLMQYEQKGREEVAKGPIVLCLDQSSSMYKLDTQAKGFALALLAIAKKQHRDFCVLAFSTKIESYLFAKGKTKSTDLVKLANTFLGGGTNFSLPLNQALKVINATRFKKADVIFVTDGEDTVSDTFLVAFNKTKKEKEFSVLSLVLGSSVTTVEPFSDKVVTLTDFTNESSHNAYEL